jgi:hypothetical protein
MAWSSYKSPEALSGSHRPKPVPSTPSDQAPSWVPRWATLLTGWWRRGAAVPTAPSSWARAAFCDCSPAQGCGTSRARGRGPPGLRAAGGPRGRGRGAGKGVPTHTPEAAPPARLGAQAPFSPQRDRTQKSQQLGKADRQRRLEAARPPEALAALK